MGVIGEMDLIAFLEVAMDFVQGGFQAKAQSGKQGLLQANTSLPHGIHD